MVEYRNIPRRSPHQRYNTMGFPCHQVYDNNYGLRKEHWTPVNHQEGYLIQTD